VKKFSHFMFIITLIIASVILVSFNYINIQKNYDHEIHALKQQGHIKIDNQLKQIDESIDIIRDYTNSLVKITHDLQHYDENLISTIFKDFFMQHLGLFQLRLLDTKGKELVRYDVNKNGDIVKALSLQDKSSRHYYKEAQALKLGETYISKLDLNEEHGEIEVPHKKTIRLVEKVDIDNSIYYIVVNVDLSMMLETALHTSFYDLFMVEEDGEINMHLEDRFAFSRQQGKNLYWMDFVSDEEAFITKKRVNSLAYDVVIAIKKSKLDAIKDKKVSQLQKSILLALIIATIIAYLLYYFLDEHLETLNRKVMHILQDKDTKEDAQFQEFQNIVENVEQQQKIIHQHILSMQKEKELTRSILDTQSNIVLITDGKSLKETNKTLLDFLNYSSLEKFKQDYDCICDLFLPGEGYLQKEIDGVNWVDIIAADITKNHRAMFNDYLGKTHIFQVYTRKLSDEKDTYVISMTDITELVSLQTSLEEKVSQQITELRQQEQRILQQSRLAQMGEMISMIAHQWRQPLSAISATTSNLTLKVMMDEMDKKEFGEEIERIGSYAQHLSKTIDDFRGFFKEEKEKEYISLDSLVHQTLDIVKVSLDHANIEVNLTLNASKEIKTHATEIKQVLLNLIKNAEDVLIEHKVHNPLIMIETSIDEKQRHILRVKDNGGGIPADILDKVFDPYFSTKLEKDGTGLGLYMSKTIIEDHCQGELTVENSDDGALFTIILRGKH
jgi:C4-dicarboxylate-specific signal transduction histidine kinase